MPNGTQLNDDEKLIEYGSKIELEITPKHRVNRIQPGDQKGLLASIKHALLVFSIFPSPDADYRDWWLP